MESGMRSSNPPKILVVEDDPVISLGIESDLRDLGYEVAGSAGTAAQAIEFVRQHPPDLVLMDIQLSGQYEGIGAAAEIRRQSVPVIFVSGYISQELIDSAQSSLVEGYLTKPIRSQELHATISLALGRRNSDSHPKKPKDDNADGRPLGDGLIIGIAGAPPPSKLSEKQRMVLALIAQSHSTKEIAHMLGISFKTAVSHRTRLMQMLGIHDVAGLTRYAVFHRLVAAK
jgi:DNA-binding NarL/FixJ family response regulator